VFSLQHVFIKSNYYEYILLHWTVANLFYQSPLFEYFNAIKKNIDMETELNII